MHTLNFILEAVAFSAIAVFFGAGFWCGHRWEKAKKRVHDASDKVTHIFHRGA